MALGWTGLSWPGPSRQRSVSLDQTEIEMQRSGHCDEPRSFFSSSGLCAHLRHPQPVCLAPGVFGFLLLSPTLLGPAMFPALVFTRARLARTEVRETLAEFGPDYERHRALTAAFAPRLGELLGGSRGRSTRRR
jgi:hypothetical protein